MGCRTTVSEKTTSHGSDGRESELQPWQQQPDESPIAYRSFLVYRDMGAERTIVAAARELGKNPSLIYRRSRRFGWRERAHAWDLAQSEEDDAAAALRRRKLQQRREADGEWFRVGALAGLRKILHRDPDTGEWTISGKMTPREIRCLYEIHQELSGARDGNARASDGHRSHAMSRAETERRLAAFRPLLKKLVSQQAAKAEEEDAP
jgi:hypothetical protein